MQLRLSFVKGVGVLCLANKAKSLLMKGMGYGGVYKWLGEAV